MQPLQQELLIHTERVHSGLNPGEETLLEQHTSVRPHVVHETIVRQGERELSRSTSALAWSGLAAGLSMGLSFIAEGLLRAHLPDAPWRPLVAKFGYSFGFIAVILGRQQLFTENTVTAVLPFLNNHSWRTFREVARLWGVVLAANLAGAHMLAWVLANTRVFAPNVVSAFADLGGESAAVSFGDAVLRGVFAGWIIALMVWILAASAQHTRIWVILFLTYLVGLGGFTHIVVGSIEVLFLVMNGSLSWMAYVTGYMIPTFLGNSLGGVSLVSALNHAQVVSDRPARAKPAPSQV